MRRRTRIKRTPEFKRWITKEKDSIQRSKGTGYAGDWSRGTKLGKTLLVGCPGGLAFSPRGLGTSEKALKKKETGGGRTVVRKKMSSVEYVRRRFLPSEEGSLRVSPGYEIKQGRREWGREGGDWERGRNPG